MTPMDRAGYRISFMASASGGMDVKKCAVGSFATVWVISLPHERYLGPQELRIRAMSVWPRATEIAT